jgi:hypothetical protein
LIAALQFAEKLRNARTTVEERPFRAALDKTQKGLQPQWKFSPWLAAFFSKLLAAEVNAAKKRVFQIT